MRAFVSVDCSPVADGVARAQAPFEGLDGLRLTDPGQAHLTLQFLGDVDATLADHAERADAAQGTGRADGTGGSDGSDGSDDGPAEDQAVPGLPALEAALGAAVDDSGVSPFDCALGGYGTFPDGDYVSVVWLGVDAGSEELTRLQGTCEAAAVDLGFDAPDHAFTPHVTLARMDHAAEKERVQRLVAERSPGVDAFRVDAVELTESTLTPDGPVYDTVARFPL